VARRERKKGEKGSGARHEVLCRADSFEKALYEDGIESTGTHVEMIQRAEV